MIFCFTILDSKRISANEIRIRIFVTLQFSHSQSIGVISNNSYRDVGAARGVRILDCFFFLLFELLSWRRKAPPDCFALHLSDCAHAVCTIKT